jgi:uncharacterized protein (DUF427 family)
MCWDGMMSDVAPNGKTYESVWDFPRPPRLERVEWRIRVVHAGSAVVDAPWALRVLETSQAPAYYVAEEYVDLRHLQISDHRTFCEWKGIAQYCDLILCGSPDARRVREAGWKYPSPTGDFAALSDMWAFYAQKVDECYVDEEQVIPNEGSFYGGWVTANVTGPYKGAPGTTHW